MAAPAGNVLRAEDSSGGINLAGDFSGALEVMPDTGASNTRREVRRQIPPITSVRISAEEYAVKNEVVREKGDKLSRNIRGTICLVIAVAVFLYVPVMPGDCLLEGLLARALTSYSHMYNFAQWRVNSGRPITRAAPLDVYTYARSCPRVSHGLPRLVRRGRDWMVEPRW
jgi:hypothetical protein